MLTRFFRKRSAEDIAQMQLGAHYLNKGDYDRAISCLKASFSKFPRDLFILNCLGHSFRGKHEFEDAKKYFKKSLSISPKDETALYGLADILRQQGNYDESLRLTKKVLRLDPQHGWAHHNLAFLHAAKRDYNDAEDEYRAALTIMPDNISVYRDLAEVLVHLGRTEEVEILLHDVVKKHSQMATGNPEVIKNIAEIYLRVGNKEKSKELYEKAASICLEIMDKQKGDIKTLLCLGEVYYAQGKDDLAVTCYEKVLQIDNSFITAYIGMGNAFKDSNKLLKAEEAFKQALQHNPRDIYALHSLGDVYKQSNRFEEAAGCFDRCKQINPHFTKPYLSLGHILVKQRKFKEALREYKKAMELDATDEEAAQGLAGAVREQKRYGAAFLLSKGGVSTLNEEEIKEIARPRFCALAVVYRCNFRCRMCNIWEYKDNKELSTEQWKRFISSFRFIADDYCQINFAGGEPFLREDLTDLISFSAQSGFVTAVCSNGSLIDESLAKKIGDSGLDTLALSLDSLNPRRHDFLRGVNGSHEHVMKAIELVAEHAPKTKLNILAIVLQENLNDLIPLAQWAQSSESINMINFLALIQPRGSSKEKAWYEKPENGILWPRDNRALNKVIDGLIEIKNDGCYKIGNPVSQFLKFKKYYESPDQYIHEHAACNMGYVFVSVNEKGNLTLCEDREPIGSIVSEDVRDILSSDKCRKTRQEIAVCRKNCHQLINCCYEEEGGGL